MCCLCLILLFSKLCTAEYTYLVKFVTLIWSGVFHPTARARFQGVRKRRPALLEQPNQLAFRLHVCKPNLTKISTLFAEYGFMPDEIVLE